MNENKCKQCQESYKIEDEDQKFYMKVALPKPTLCPSCRQQRRFAYRNELNLYHRDCDKCGSDMISMFSAQYKGKVYCKECWWSDDFQPLDYGRDYDFNKAFFHQFEELMLDVPLPNLIIGNCENADYTNYSWSNKNSYLLSSSDYCENCYYSTYLFRSQNCFDCLFVNDSELCIECIDVKNCYSCAYCQNCRNLTDCFLCFDCRGSTDCLGCVGLRNKQYYIVNKRYSKEEYFKKKKELLKNIDTLKKQFQDYKLKFPHKFAEIENCENSRGDHLNSSKNLRNCFDMLECEDCSYSEQGLKSKDLYDCTGMPSSELCYESLACPENYNLKFCAVAWGKSSYLEYCMLSRFSNYCFGSVSLIKNKFCILNKQYTEVQYKKIVQEIIEQMKSNLEYGEFFPIKISPFAYNETIAQDYFSLNKEKVLSNGWTWIDEEKDILVNTNQDLSICEVTGKPFRILPIEKKSYERMGLSLSKRSPVQRHKDRFKLRNTRRLWNRSCNKCDANVSSSYSSNRKEIIYCEECYLKNI